MSDTSIQPLFRVADIPGKGKGLLAARDLKRGTLIIAEPPLFTMPNFIPSVAGAGASILASRMDSLSPAQKSAFYALHDCHNPKAPQPMTIIHTNALPLGVNATNGGIFPTIARKNHACLPNAHHSWNSARQMEVVYAVAEIKADTEILTCYEGGWQGRDERRQMSWEKFKFWCNCAGCTRADVNESDARRARIRQLEDATPLRLQTNPKAALAGVREQIRLLDEEGIVDTSLKGRFFYDAFQTCVAWSDFEFAKKWAGLGYVSYLIAEGPDGENTLQAAENKRHRLAGAMGIKNLQA
ncbi:hypothetical protein HK104_002326 [Borealophlyctis nickersoniae]|nr:hypothetical protein HK104_002326 [Borealophlyctis nickersoniae]